MMIKDKHPRTVPIPVHGSKALPKGTLASIIRMAGKSCAGAPQAVAITYVKSRWEKLGLRRD
jgi:hypothetical protein